MTPPTRSITRLRDLDDVDHAVAPADGQIPVWHAAQSKFVFTDFAGGTADTTAPHIVSAHVNGAALVLTFSEPLAALVPAGAAFAVSGAGSGVHATTGAPVIAGATVTLTLATPVLPGEFVSVAYTQPGANPRLQDVAGNLVPTLPAFAANNDTPGSFQSGGGGETVLVGASVAALGAGPFDDGQPAVIRVGAWPNLHEERLRWNAAQNKWVGDPITIVTQNDTLAMDLGDKSGARLVDWGFIRNAIPYGKAFATLAGAQAANSAAINVSAVAGHGVQFAVAGTILIRDNIITYTGISGPQNAPFSFTGCALVSGSGGAIPSTVDVVQGFPGGFGMVVSPLAFAAELWAAGLRLQEKLTALMNGEPGGARALTIAPYWYEYNAADGSIPPADPPTGTGIGFSASLAGPATDGGAKETERTFYWEENPWSLWAAGVPTKRFLVPAIYGKMAAGAIDTGEVLDTCLRARWVSA